MQEKVVNPATGTAQAAALPIYKSTVAVGIIVSLLFKGLALWKPEWAQYLSGYEAEATQVIFLVISAGGDAVALIARIWSGLQPLTVTPGAAKEIARVSVVLLSVGFLLGCNTPSGGTVVATPGVGAVTNAQVGVAVGTITAAVLQAAPDTVVEAAKSQASKCDFIPSVATVLQVATTLVGLDFNSAIELGTYIGQGICAAVRGPAVATATEAYMSGGTARRSATPTFNGVVIKGTDLAPQERRPSNVQTPGAVPAAPIVRESDLQRLNTAPRSGSGSAPAVR